MNEYQLFDRYLIYYVVDSYLVKNLAKKTKKVTKISLLINYNTSTYILRIPADSLHNQQKL